MGNRMKTTVQIPDRLLADARRIASREGTTLKAVIEEALIRLVRGRHNSRPFKLRKATFRGTGMHPDFADGSWSRIRDAIYEGRGT